ncbi:DUF2339 domain-containing protein [Pseudonocardia broussonetiae]|uniref:DUF2339 domain-containing protein n=1 Tax=Pseudonocardia broussonetiae TaxID=2736640 RepID=A0A6M6JFT9_9PSEU|nr:DUF2339 domain-containing protein [Pseudonocardia broussonetiae]QJY45995.1 DUF2339 domain-containing protein [Pseudonocardia broussonetiae]
MTSTPDLAAELASLGRRLDSVEARLQAFGVPEAGPSAPVGAADAPSDAPAGASADAVMSVLERPAAPTAPRGTPAAPAWGPPSGAPAWGPPPSAPWAPQPQPQPQPAAPWSTGLPAGWGRPPVAAPGAPAPASRATAGGARLLAWTGGAMTLLGVVLFLALAASRGWGTPAARVWSGAVLGVVLVAFGTWMHRVETRRGGALAVAGTGFAALYLVVAAANRLLGLAEPLAVLLALVVAAAGLALADRWRSALLASGIVVGGAVLAPVLVEGPLLVALLLALQVAVAAVALRRGWSWPALLAAAGPALTASVVVFDSDPWRILAVLATALLGLAGAALAVRRLPDGVVGGLVALAVLPALVLGPEVDGWGGAGIAAAAGLLALALLAVPGVGSRLRAALVAVAAVAVLEAVLVALDGPVATGTLLVVAVALAGTAVAVRDRLPFVVAGGFWLVGTLLAIAVDAPIAALVDFPQYPYLVDGRGQTAELVGGIVVSLLVLLASVALTVAGGRLRLVRPDSATAGIWVPLGVAGLYGTAGLIVTLALLVSPERTAFTVGHAIVTVSWTVVALVLLARGLRRPALRVTGLVLVAGAVAKLVLFDLVVLDGLAQVAAFLGAGLVLLAAGTRYARMVAEAG